jgi:N-acetyl-beta-hexosaminidase
MIVGEMDVPGHASGMVKAMPEIFGFPSQGGGNGGSSSSSGSGGSSSDGDDKVHDNNGYGNFLGAGSSPVDSSGRIGIVNLVNKSTVRAIQDIFDEIQEVFPSPYVHIGADEVNFGALSGVKEVKDAIANRCSSNNTRSAPLSLNASDHCI